MKKVVAGAQARTIGPAKRLETGEEVIATRFVKPAQSDTCCARDDRGGSLGRSGRREV
jgi:hypothetical protein